MKKALIIILPIFAIAFLGYLLSVPRSTDAGSPSIEIIPSSHDFGNVIFGETVSRDFIVLNNGDADLEIRRITTSCACTSAEISETTIVSGGEATLSVVYDSGSMGRSHASGEEERIISIRSNDPFNPHFEVRIYANIE